MKQLNSLRVFNQRIRLNLHTQMHTLVGQLTRAKQILGSCGLCLFPGYGGLENQVLVS